MNKVSRTVNGRHFRHGMLQMVSASVTDRHSKFSYGNKGTRTQPPKPINDILGELLEQIHNVTDPWLLFLCVEINARPVFDFSFLYRKGLVLLRTGRRDEAIEATILSIGSYPWNWSAWELLVSCIKDGEEVTLMSCRALDLLIA
jgi:hypothetical protein